MGAGRHQGDDIMAPKGSPVYAAKDGVVDHLGYDRWNTRLISIRHPDGTYTRYLHMSGIAVKEGQPVTGGKPIGLSGSANSVPHLHFEVWYGKPNGAGSRLLSPRKIFGWDKTHMPQGGARADERNETTPSNEPPKKMDMDTIKGHPFLGKIGQLPGYINGGKIINNQSTVNKSEFGSVTVNSQAADAPGIASDIRDALAKQSSRPANFDERFRGFED